MRVPDRHGVFLPDVRSYGVFEYFGECRYRFRELGIKHFQVIDLVQDEQRCFMAVMIVPDEVEIVIPEHEVIGIDVIGVPLFLPVGHVIEPDGVSCDDGKMYARQHPERIMMVLFQERRDDDLARRIRDHKRRIDVCHPVQEPVVQRFGQLYPPHPLAFYKLYAQLVFKMIFNIIPDGFVGDARIMLLLRGDECGEGGGVPVSRVFVILKQGQYVQVAAKHVDLRGWFRYLFFHRNRPPGSM